MGENKFDKENIHAGHRQRLRERFIKSGADAMFEHELLELFLAHIIPRRDVKPIAKSLLKCFGSLGAVINASMEELTAVSGVGETTAVMLKLMSYFHTLLNRENQEHSSSFNDHRTLYDYLRKQSGVIPDESIFFLLFDKNNRLIKSLDFSGNCRHSLADPKKIIAQILACKATASVVIAHNHPSGSLMPSIDDLRMTAYFRKVLRTFNIELADHLILSQQQCVSLLKKDRFYHGKK